MEEQVYKIRMRHIGMPIIAHHFRAKVFGGWLVGWLVGWLISVVLEDNENMFLKYGYQWRSGITFMPDLEYKWKD